MSQRGIAAIDSPVVPLPASWSIAGWAVIGLLGAVGLAMTGAWIAAAALVALGLGLLMVRFPQSAIYCFAFLLYTNAPVVASRFHGVPSAVVAASAGLLLIPLLYQWVLRRDPIVITPALPWLGALIAFRLVAVLWASDRALALDAVVSTFAEGFVLYLLLTSVIRDESTLRRVIWTIVASGALLGSLSVIQQLMPSGNLTFGGFAQTSIDDRILELETPRQARSAGPVGEKNYYAQFMVFLIPLAIGLARCEWKSRSRSLVAYSLMGLIAMGVATTASRGAAVGFVAMVVAFVLLRELRLRSVAWLSVGALSLVMLFPAYRERLQSMLVAIEVLPGGGEIQSVEKSLQGRISEMSAAAILFAHHPVGGVGPGNFPPEFLKQAGSLGFQVHAEQRMAHCCYLEIAAETGVVGLAIYVAILFVIIRSLWTVRLQAMTPEQHHLATSLLMLMVVLVTTGLFLSFAFERYYWFVLALAASGARVLHTADTRRDLVASKDSLPAGGMA